MFLLFLTCLWYFSKLIGEFYSCIMFSFFCPLIFVFFFFKKKLYVYTFFHFPCFFHFFKQFFLVNEMGGICFQEVSHVFHSSLWFSIGLKLLMEESLSALRVIPVSLHVDASACKGMLLRHGCGHVKHLATKQLLAQDAVKAFSITVCNFPCGVRTPQICSHTR